MNQSVNDEAVYRTAPATPGLLNTNITFVLHRNFKNFYDVQSSNHTFFFFIQMSFAKVNIFWVGDGVRVIVVEQHKRLSVNPF